MDIIYSRLFWGSIIILLGFSIILNAVFKINIPFFKIVVSLLIIYFGVNMLLGSFKKKNGTGSSDVFSSSTLTVDPSSIQKEYSVVFGSQVLDLTNITDGADKSIELNAVFGSQKVYLNANTKVRIKANSVFGQVSMPNNNSVSFGDDTYNQSPENTLSAGTLYLEANAVFGDIKIYNQK